MRVSASGESVIPVRRWWTGVAFRVSVLILVVFVALGAVLIRSCSTSDVGKVGAGSVGVEITSDCDGPFFATAGDTEDDAVTQLAAAPIEFSRGQRSQVSIVTFEGYEAQRYFLAFRTDPTADPVVREFPIDDVKSGGIRLRFAADCETLS